MQALQSYGSRSNELFKKCGRDLPRNLQWIFEYDSIAVFAIFQSVKRGKGEYVVSSIHLLCLQCHKQPEEPFEVSLCNRRKWWIPENCLWHMCVSCAVYRCLLVNLNNRKKYFGFFLAVAAAAVVIQSLFGTLVFCLLDFIAVLLCKSLLMHTLCTWRGVQPMCVVCFWGSWLPFIRIYGRIAASNKAFENAAFHFAYRRQRRRRQRRSL